MVSFEANQPNRSSHPNRNPGMLTSVMLTMLVAGSAIALTPGVITVPKLVKELAEKSGLQLKTSPEVANDVLYVNLKPRDPTELMTLIARADAAEWDHNVLTRTNKLKAKQLVQEREADAKWLKDRFNETQTGDPFNFLAGKLLKNILSKSDFKTFKVPVGETVDFDSHPTPMQTLLRVSSADLSAYNADRKRVATDKGDNRKYTTDSHWFPTLSATDVRISVERPGINEFGFSLSTFSSDHKELDHVFWAAEPSTPLPQKKWSSELTNPPLAARGFIETLGTDAWRTLEPFARKPADFEPLEIMLSEPLSRIAEGEEIWHLEDRDSTRAIAKETLGNLYQTLAEDWQVESKNGVTIAAPRHPLVAAAIRTDRRKLQDLITNCTKVSVVDLDALSQYSASTSLYSYLSRLEANIFLVLPKPLNSAFIDLAHGEDRTEMRLYYALTPGQRAALRKGGQLHLRDLSESALSAIHRIIFKLGDTLYSDFSQQMTDSAATWIWPNGLTGDMTLSAKYEDELGAYDLREGKDVTVYPISRLAEAIVKPSSDTTFLSSALTPIVTTTIWLTIANGTSSHKFSLFDYQVQAPAGPYQTFPAAFQTELRKEIQKLIAPVKAETKKPIPP